MISFKQFLMEDDVVPTKRKGMAHLEKMKPVDFVELMDHLKQRFPNGVLKNVAIDLKVDGIGFRFGKDVNSRPFVESSYSGPVYNPGRFVAYAMERGDPGMISRAEKTEEVFNILMASDLMKAVPKDRKIVCEVMYNPLGEMVRPGIVKFANISYDTSKLGKVMTVAPFAVLVASTGERADDEEQILSTLYKTTNDQVKVVSTKLSHHPIDISATIDTMKSITPAAIPILQSRKGADKPAKDALIQTIEQAKNQLAQIIMKADIQGKHILGDEVEGFVLSAGDHQVKITTPHMKNLMANKVKR